jgi:hypothetical protein
MDVSRVRVGGRNPFECPLLYERHEDSTEFDSTHGGILI